MHSPLATTVPSLVIIKQMVHKLLSGQCCDEDQWFDIDLVTPKCNINNFLSKVNQYSKFYNHQTKGHN